MLLFRFVKIIYWKSNFQFCEFLAVFILREQQAVVDVVLLSESVETL